MTVSYSHSVFAQTTSTTQCCSIKCLSNFSTNDGPFNHRNRASSLILQPSFFTLKKKLPLHMAAPSQRKLCKFVSAPPRNCFSAAAVDISNAQVAAAEIIHNKVLVAAAVSAAIGQLSKPFTSTILYGNNFDFRATVQAGGFPSTHSSAAVATATTLGLERGFSDAIFGLAVVYACLIMYDAQGVRREVGSHAKTLNKVLFGNKLNPISSTRDANDFTDTIPADSSSLETCDPPFLGKFKYLQQKLPTASLLLQSDEGIEDAAVQKTSAVATDVKRTFGSSSFDCTPLKESVGHTEVEVVAGALLGFLVSVAVCTI